MHERPLLRAGNCLPRTAICTPSSTCRLHCCAGSGHAVRYERIRVSLAQFDVLHTGGQCSPIGSPLWVVQWA